MNTLTTTKICLACRHVSTNTTDTACMQCGMMLEEQCPNCKLPKSECVCPENQN